MQLMHRRWISLVNRCGNSDGGQLFRDLDRAYSHPARAYHNWQHILECLDLLEDHRNSIAVSDEELCALELALWYHDIVYAAGASDNEKRSALLARVAAAKMGLGRQADLVADLVEATDHGSEAVERAIFNLIRDIDLAILASPESRFDEYERQIREEYRAIPDESFRSGRAEFLTGLLNRKVIYRIPEIRTERELPARSNLKRSLARLGHAGRSSV